MNAKERLREFCRDPKKLRWDFARRDHTHRLTCFEVGNEGYVVFGDENGSAFVRNLETEELTLVSTRKDKKVSGVALNPSSEMAVVCDNSPVVTLCSFRGGVREAKQSFDEPIRCAVFVEDLANRQNLLLSGGARRVFVSDCATGIRIALFDGHKGGVSTIRSWGGCLFLSASLGDRVVRLWDLRTPRNPIKEFPAGSRDAPSSGFAVGSGGRFLARLDASRIVLFDLRTGRQLASYAMPSPSPKALQFFPESLTLAVCRPKSVSLTDLQYPQPPTQHLPVEDIETPRFPRWNPSTDALFFADGTSLVEASVSVDAQSGGLLSHTSPRT
ncbi:hypothetical protein QR680_017454 [Steinernema hermaphroditum]|uniref:WD repeat-containing protein 55 homolog n=1 Tax=Steinernema hermaphroditum TaxID=289476 RepID=A0AA39HEM0_9BILA|nr:hypothetical protein QR680_017454 [Steinernema hermaphroditum]